MWQESASGTIINRSAIIELVWVDLCSDVVGGCRPVLLDAFILSYRALASGAAADRYVRAFQCRCFSAALLADWLGGESELKKTLLPVASRRCVWDVHPAEKESQAERRSSSMCRRRGWRCIAAAKWLATDAQRPTPLVSAGLQPSKYPGVI